MPLYQYECTSCGNAQEARKPYEERRLPEMCKKCGLLMCEYVVSAVAGFMKGGPTVPSNRRRIKK